MKNTLLYLLLLIFTFGCNKTERAVPNSKEDESKTVSNLPPGSLSGTISPVEATSRIIAMFVGTSKYYVIEVDKVSGRFNLADLPEGDYVLHFDVDPRYESIKDINTKVISGKTTDLGTFAPKMIDSPIEKPVLTQYTISCEVDGVFGGWNYSSVFSSAQFTIARFSIGTFPEDNRIAFVPAIMLKNVTGPGTYICNGTTANKITYSSYHLGSGFRRSYNSTEYEGGEGVVVITSIDNDARIIKGTFSAKLPASSKTSENTKLITNGVINAKF